MLNNLHNIPPPVAAEPLERREPPRAYLEESTPGVLMDGALHRRLCVVRHFDGRVRLVEPYRVFRSKGGRRLLTCYQVAGYTRGTDPNGWKNLYLEDIYSAALLDRHYDDRRAPRPRAAPRKRVRSTSRPSRDPHQLELLPSA